MILNRSPVAIVPRFIAPLQTPTGGWLQTLTLDTHKAFDKRLASESRSSRKRDFIPKTKWLATLPYEMFEADA